MIQSTTSNGLSTVNMTSIGNSILSPNQDQNITQTNQITNSQNNQNINDDTTSFE